MTEHSSNLTLTIDPSVETGRLTPIWNKCVGSDHGELFLRPTALQHLKDGHDVLGFQYVRFHGILSDITPKNADAPLNVDWKKLDDIYDRILGTGVRVVVEFSFMPEPMAVDRSYIFHWKGNITPPKDYALWEQLIEDFVRHLVDRYGEEEILRWYFEVWNEPNLESFWANRLEEYFKMYDSAARAVKRVNPKFKVGGPATAGGMWVKEMCEHVVNENVPCDFISYHGYPTDKGLYERDKDITYRDRDYWVLMTRENYEITKKYLPEAEILVTEWNTTPCSQDDHSHDDANCAAYVCQTIQDAEGTCDAFSYWAISDIFEEQGPGDGEFYGGFGLITLNGVRKPSFNGFQMLHMLGERKVSAEFEGYKPAGVSSYATTKDDGSIQVLVWNYAHPDAKDNEDAEVTVKVSLPDGKSRTLTHYRIDETHSNAFTLWNQMGCPKEPTPQQVEELRSAGMLKRLAEPQQVTGDRCTVTVPLPQGTVSMMVLG